MSVTEHKKEAPHIVRCKVITISDTRTKDTDKSGKLMMDLLKEAGHEVVSYEIVKDEKEAIREAILRGCEQTNIDVVLTNGGTGIAKRDVTIETVKEIIEKEIVGFGELFRMLSYTEDIGSAAILSRAIAGVANDTAIFSTPGSSGAVRLAMTKLILPELGHVMREIRKDLR
ncbi:MULTISPECIES: MogA/MoaB family molybdenum cofactor biosynthesis protein [unclassified Geobacillus]|uniref:MogA/MoaB family molybdenum cofactor biosynthesis protein n=1 Tax=unclassified Geobacillus TaxID=2642459 RepID=UPI000BE4681A|nr:MULTISPECIES: MogA/MoaB family molybdenum cofactor biosynthesis protein [unclassified Geobacillus]PDM41618.1 molybdenum cofactor biosynthesis protein [Parageobacillus yumthangensis]RDV20932.1 MogA/MoaB family molybdenum cofactor biosynthesis protein [Parageobacillus toebii]TXK90511.1 MogA/MoaB family molybdenum cofactor biosynthesis protein [Parageobacillus sp. SY1]PUF90088.1 MogA/MoaB family molybdenum cofactor biosynthesis protein [Geobacillus sp. LYN3]TXK87030.1 MogA/MoaB family molybden